MKNKRPNASISEELVKNSLAHTNVAQVFLTTTEDKIKLTLIEHRDALQSQRDWIGPATTLIALIGTLATADFRERCGIKPEVWCSLFIWSACASAIWLLKVLFNIWRCREKWKIQYVVDRLKIPPTE